MARVRRQTSIREIVSAAFFTLGIIWLVYLLWGIVDKEERARTSVGDTKAELDSLVARQTTLAADLNALDTPRGKEAAVRETLGVAKEGEEVIIVVPQTAPTTTPTVPTWWERLLNWF